MRIVSNKIISLFVIVLLLSTSEVFSQFNWNNFWFKCYSIRPNYDLVPNTNIGGDRYMKFEGKESENFIFLLFSGLGCYDYEFDSIPDWVEIENVRYFGVRIKVKKNSSTASRSSIIKLVDDNKIVGSIRVYQEGTRVYYVDSDGDGFGDYDSEVFYFSSPRNGYVTNNSDFCPKVYSTSNSGCEFNYENRNWVSSTTKDITGKLISSSKSYYNSLGKLEQTQSYDIKYKRTWANQVLYDDSGRLALQTFSSPITASNTSLSFSYKDDFILRSSDNAPFTKSDYLAKDTILTPVSTQKNSLGWYYSDENTDEPLQDITDTPYSKYIYSKLQPGSIKEVIGGNKMVGKWRRGYSFTVPVAQEMSYVYGYDYFPSNPPIQEVYSSDIYKVLPSQEGSSYTHYRLKRVRQPNDCIALSDIVWSDYDLRLNIEASFSLTVGKVYKIDYEGELLYVQVITASDYGKTNDDRDAARLLAGSWDSCEELYATALSSSFHSVVNNPSNKVDWLRASKTVVEDIHGNESVLFTDSDGKTMGTARSGGVQQYTVLSLIGSQRFVDIHIPKGCERTAQLLGNSSDYRIYDLKTEKVVPASALQRSGFYRVEYVGSKQINSWDNLVYINKSDGSLSAVGQGFGVRYKVNYYDYSLNYYNAIGQVTATTQPLGFNPNCLTSLQSNVQHDKKLESTFTYNTLGQLVESSSPDEGVSRFKYRKDGKIRFSQNTKQKTQSSWREQFSYTNYDRLGRPIESGVATGDFSSLDPDAPLNLGLYYKNEINYTGYDYLDKADQSFLDSIAKPEYRNPTHLSSNVAVVKYVRRQAAIPLRVSSSKEESKRLNKDYSVYFKYSSTKYYSYDIYGRIKWTLEYRPDLAAAKTIDYEYDPVTGSVLKVIYQKGNSTEQFVHKYTYDSDDGSLVQVETSRDNLNFVTHATYKYYETGALKSKILGGGDLQNIDYLQKVDYVYTLDGKLKAINHPVLDSSIANQQQYEDLFGMTIDYYSGDYLRDNKFNLPSTATNQYNGNIKSIHWNTQDNFTWSNTPILRYDYSYDKNNWLTAASFFRNDVSIPQYKVSNISYDANGNIQTLHRNKGELETNYINGAPKPENSNYDMDKLIYHYNQNKPNQLAWVEDLVVSDTGVNDIKSQVPNNYKYNTIGQLTSNTQENLKYEYYTNGQVKALYNEGYVNSVVIDYDFSGSRARKYSYFRDSYSYINDPSGNVVAIYKGDKLIENPIYGLGRIGIDYKMGDVNYEITDHLGNVRVVFQYDSEIGAAYTANNSDYYPFGMPMPNREVDGGYRYAFQGQEKDPETGKEAFKLRLWDGRIGRWLTTDPYGQYHSPYLGMGNDPVNGIDPDGGWKTKWRRFWAWVGGGFKGSFIGSGNASDPMKNYGIRTTETTSFSEIDGGFSQEISITDNYGIRNAQLSAARGIFETQNFAQSLNDMGMEASITNSRREAMNSNINFMVGLALPTGKLAGTSNIRNSVTTSDGFLFGSVGFKAPVDIRVGLYASENTLKYGTFKWSTIAPKALTKHQSFGRNMLQITPDFQPVLGRWSTQVIRKGTHLRVGLVGPQKGTGFGTWLQFYAPQGVKFTK